MNEEMSKSPTKDVESSFLHAQETNYNHVTKEDCSAPDLPNENTIMAALQSLQITVNAIGNSVKIAESIKHSLYYPINAPDKNSKKMEGTEPDLSAPSLVDLIRYMDESLRHKMSELEENLHMIRDIIK